MKFKLLVAALALGAAFPAYAADAVVEEVVVVDTAYDWSGVYVGAQVGYAWADSHIDLLADDSTWDLEPDGVLGGAYAGYNYQFTNGLVLGVETEFNANGGSDTAPRTFEGLPDLDLWTADLDLKWSGSTRARLGYAMDRWLPYVTGGVAYAGYDFRTHYQGSVYDEGDGTLTGWALGAGVEYAVTDNIRVRGSYLYSDFGTKTFDAFAPAGYFTYARDIDLETHALQIGVSFNW